MSSLVSGVPFDDRRLPVFGHQEFVSPVGGSGLWPVTVLGTAATDETSEGGVRATRTTSTTQDNQAYWVQNTTVTSVKYKPYMMLRFGLLSTTNCRFFSGAAERVTDSATTVTTALSASNPVGQRMCGVAYDTSRGDLTFKWIEDDNSAQTVTDTGVTPDVDATYIIEIDISSLGNFSMSLFSITESASDRTLLSSRLVTSSPFAGTEIINYVHGIRNLAATEAGETKSISLYIGYQVWWR